MKFSVEDGYLKIEKHWTPVSVDCNYVHNLATKTDQTYEKPVWTGS